MKHGRPERIGRPGERQDGARHILTVSVMATLCLFGLLFPGSLRAQEADSLRLVWTAPADVPDGGRVAAYDARMALGPITEANFATALELPTSVPHAPGERETLVVHGLVAGRTYWFAIRSRDGAGNWSALSNLVSGTVPTGPPDTAPPAAPTAMAVTEAPEGGSTVLQWTAGTEPDLAGYEVYRAVDPAGEWTLLNAALLAKPAYTDAQLPANADRVWYCVTAFDRSGNESARSAPVVVVLREAHGLASAAWKIAPPFPNPMRAGAEVWIPVEAPTDRRGASVRIFDVSGRAVCEHALSHGVLGLGVAWDGRDDRGRPCAPGMYLAQLVAGAPRGSTRIVRLP